MTLNRHIVALAVFTERYVLSVVYFCLAWGELQKTWNFWFSQPVATSAVVVESGRHLTVLLLTLFTGVLLLFGRRTAEPPQQLKYILIPLATTFFNLTYSAVHWFPRWLQLNLCPARFQMWLFFAGLTCIILGPVFALWGLVHLGRSFGVFVTVRKVVLTGPYQWTRHPMYLGWVCSCFGLAIANCSVAYVLLVTTHISLLLYRARLEESQLSEHSAEYREYMTHSGFLFPRFRQPIAGLLKTE